MERSSQAQLIAMAAGEPKPLDAATAKLTYDQVGLEYAGWFQFQPLYQRIVASQPDLLD
jgi:hypothetical protein